MSSSTKPGNISSSSNNNNNSEGEEASQSTSKDSLSDCQWIIHGNIVVPTEENPFLTSTNASSPNKNKGDSIDICENDIDNGDDIIELGPGLQIRIDYVLTVNTLGVITHMEPAKSFFQNHSFTSNEPDKTSVIKNHPGYIALDPNREFLCPGLIDLHLHAAQYEFMGSGTDRPLMGADGWLESYTFPTEQRFGHDIKFARNVYENVVKTTLNLGTTTAVYFATLDLEPTKRLVDIALQYGQRALIGKVCMDRNSPTDYCHSTKQNLHDTQKLIQYIRQQHQSKSSSSSPLVLPLITPRFIPTCTPELLQGLGEMAKTEDCHITSHISESIDEVEFTKQLDIKDHPTFSSSKGRSDSEIFHSHQLLTSKCIMAHGVYLSDSDLDLLNKQGTAIAHCPLSNFFFAGASLPCRTIASRGNRIGLGTDIAGGYSPSMWNACRNAVIASLILQQQQHQPDHQNEQQQQQQHSIDYIQAFCLATLGGAKALGLNDKIGTFKVGMEFDALVLSATTNSNYNIGYHSNMPSASAAPTTTFDNKHHNHLADTFQKLFNLGDDRNVTRVFVQGRQVV